MLLTEDEFWTGVDHLDNVEGIMNERLPMWEVFVPIEDGGHRLLAFHAASLFEAERHARTAFGRHSGFVVSLA